MPVQAAMRALPPEHAERHSSAAVLPWVERLARAVLRGERIGLVERDHDEQVAILKALLELVVRRTRRRRAADCRDPQHVSLVTVGEVDR